MPKGYYLLGALAVSLLLWVAIIEAIRFIFWGAVP